MGHDDRARVVHRPVDCAEPLDRAYDVAMLDLDGVVYRGDGAVPGAVDALCRAQDAGMRVAYVTNNASRTPATVAERLRMLGAPVEDGAVVTSAQAAARITASMVPPGSRVLVVGGDGLVQALTEHDLQVVHSADDAPAAVAQGFDPGTDWAQLAEGAYAVARGVPWIASNTDPTIPTARGVAPGNGAFVDAVAAATGAEPLVAGKPEPPLFDETVRRVGGRRPLVVGDRLETDIEGANAVGADSLLVLTGVSGVHETVHAPPHRRPTYIGRDLDALQHPQHAIELERPTTCTCEGIVVHGDQGRLTPSRTGPSPGGEATALLRATVALGWSLLDSRAAPTVEVGAVLRYLEQMVQ